MPAGGQRKVAGDAGQAAEIAWRRSGGHGNPKGCGRPGEKNRIDGPSSIRTAG
jgi:hypothetical protein